MRNNKFRLFWLFLLVAPTIIAGLLIFGRSIDYHDSEILELANFRENIENGAYVFNASGCAGCHMSPGSTNRMELGGGKPFQTAFGTFYAPNVSMSTSYGLGSWTLSDFNDAVRNGVSPQGNHYFPSFPYTAYSRMKDKDIVDLWSYWQTLPSIDVANIKHDLDFPFTLRKGIWFWKKAYLKREWVFEEADPRGVYLVEALAHCGECHTPRNKLGGLTIGSWMEGAKNPVGAGRIPNILSSTREWSLEDIEEYLLSGFTPEFDTAGGIMVEVIESTALLRPEDRKAIAKYVKALSTTLE